MLSAILIVVAIMFLLSFRCCCSHAHPSTRGMMITQDARGAPPGLRAQGWPDQEDAEQDALCGLDLQHWKVVVVGLPAFNTGRLS